MPVKTIEWVGGQDGVARMIDQTLLPAELKYLDVKDVETMWEAIKTLRIRGAPAIGIAAAFGVYLAVRNTPGDDYAAFKAELDRAADYLGSARPTAVNLFWALRRIQNLAAAHTHEPVPAIQARILDEAKRMIDEDNTVCRAIGEFGLQTLLEQPRRTSTTERPLTVLTHCNAGGLATAQWGTALAPIYLAAERGILIHVYVDETRPLLQGARITAWELQQAGIPVTLITDNMAAAVMAQGRIDAVIVGTDRVAANGDVANKIGTLGVAILAKEFGVPFYVAAPTSSIDMQLESGDLIPIEERKAEEVTEGFGRRTAPVGVAVYNPAFDVTPHRYVTALITENGVLRPPYTEALNRLFTPTTAGM
ncbi:MAG: S-methyl-5-thioribose-1-phosphate isomerase [Anaerolineae bacterium]|nr:S-methyl-5-thioribose-1-phosphate isomerase [Thermoflexales bacterium]MDW8407034.1 S-methyl-5-thioribose-1-phosphate isomerase [Anaerolineae bacterium]